MSARDAADMMYVGDIARALAGDEPHSEPVKSAYEAYASGFNGEDRNVIKTYYLPAGMSYFQERFPEMGEDAAVLDMEYRSYLLMNGVEYLSITDGPIDGEFAGLREGKTVYQDYHADGPFYVLVHEADEDPNKPHTVVHENAKSGLLGLYERTEIPELLRDYRMALDMDEGFARGAYDRTRTLGLPNSSAEKDPYKTVSDRTWKHMNEDGSIDSEKYWWVRHPIKRASAEVSNLTGSDLLLDLLCGGLYESDTRWNRINHVLRGTALAREAAETEAAAAAAGGD